MKTQRTTGALFCVKQFFKDGYDCYVVLSASENRTLTFYADGIVELHGCTDWIARWSADDNTLSSWHADLQCARYWTGHLLCGDPLRRWRTRIIRLATHVATADEMWAERSSDLRLRSNCMEPNMKQIVATAEMTTGALCGLIYANTEHVCHIVVGKHVLAYDANISRIEDDLSLWIIHWQPEKR